MTEPVDVAEVLEMSREGADVVQALLNGDRVEDMDKDRVMRAVAHGLIERREQTKPCRTCGTERFDFGYWKATPAGCLLAALRQAASTARQDATNQNEGE